MKLSIALVFGIGLLFEYAVGLGSVVVLYCIVLNFGEGGRRRNRSGLGYGVRGI